MSSIDSNFSNFNIKIEDNQSKLTDFQKTFWGLGKDSIWMQVFDGKHHRFGKDVFDKGLHAGEIEPGYFDSVVKACEFASENLGNELNIDFYKELHKIACFHIKRDFDINEIRMGSGSLYAGEMIKNLFIEDKDYENFYDYFKYTTYIAVKDYLIGKDSLSAEEQKKIESLFIKSFNQLPHNITFDEISKTTEAEIWLKKNDEWVRDYDFKCERKLNSLRREIEKVSIFLGTEKRIVEVFDRGVLILDYESEKYSGRKYEHQVEIVIKEYNQNIKEAKTDDEKLRSIASLFQKLEWIHPFLDGQGRTDIILLSKLLVENGFTPPILQELFISSTNNLEDWTEYLKKGIENWKKVRKDIGKA